MTQSPQNRPLLYALSANAALLFAILAVLVSRGPTLTPSTFAAPMTPQPIAGNGNLYLMPGQLLNNVWGCYILDTDNQTLCTYAYNGNQLRLIAARNIRYDHAMGNYNTHPDPDEIRKLVEIEREKARGVIPPPATQPTAQP